jgi:uncharacterized transporter YbjL
MKESKNSNKQDIQIDKAKRGWWFSVFFMLLVVGLIMFLSFVKIEEKNRDVLVGMLGMLTGAISSMLAIASGRDPSEVEDLKDKLSSANADRQALIARLRDSQIQMQLLREQIFELQNAVINKLSLFVNEEPIKTKNENQVILDKHVEEWLPTDRDNYNG